LRKNPNPKYGRSAKSGKNRTENEKKILRTIQSNLVKLKNLEKNKNLKDPYKKEGW